MFDENLAGHDPEKQKIIQVVTRTTVAVVQAIRLGLVEI